MKTLIINTAGMTDKQVLQCIPLKDNCEVIDTTGLKIGHCTGCTCCWLKTPGICAQKDDYVEIFKRMLLVERVFVVAEAQLGFISYKAKNLFDRIIPALNVNLHFVDKMMRHIPRYDYFPSMGLVCLGDANKGMLERWMQKVAVNLATTSAGVYLINENVL